MKGLTPTEGRVLDALGTGRTNAEIGEELGMAESTVKFHLSNLYGKLGVRNRVEALSEMVNIASNQNVQRQLRIIQNYYSLHI